MDQFASRTPDVRQGSRVRWPSAIFSPQVSLIKQDGGPPEVRAATPSVMGSSRQRRRVPQQASCATGEVHGDLLGARAMTAKGRMQFQTGIIRPWIIGRWRSSQRVYNNLMPEGRRS